MEEERHRKPRPSDSGDVEYKKKKKRKSTAPKHNKVKPDDDLTSLNEDKLAKTRNDKVIKKAEKQMQFDNQRVSVDKGHHGRPHSGHQLPRKDPSRSFKRVKQSRSRVSTLRNPKTHKKPQKKKVEKDPAWISDLSLRTVKSGKSQAVFVWDAVAILVVIGIIFCLVALILEIVVFVQDFHWNMVLKGEAAITDTNGQDPLIFDGKTFDLDGDMYLIKAREYAMRAEFEELAFIIVISFCLCFVIIHLFGCYVRPNASLGESPLVVVVIHVACGALCILSSLLLVSAVIDIENNFEYSADMLYNFQHKFDNEYPSMDSLPDDCSGEEYQPGCETYEYSKKLAYFLENIFRLCAQTSRYSKYYNSDDDRFHSVQVFNITYTKTELTNMGFCAPDGYKYLAAFFAIIAGIIFSIIPVVYCCEGRGWEEEEEEEEEEQEVEVIVPPEEEEVEVEVVEAEPEPEPEKVIQKKKCSVVNRCAMIKEFKGYVAKDSEPEEEPRRMKKSDCKPRPPAPVCQKAEVGTMCRINANPQMTQTLMQGCPQMTQTPRKVCKEVAVGCDTETKKCVHARETQYECEAESIISSSCTPAVAVAPAPIPCTCFPPPPPPVESQCDYCTCDCDICYCQCD